MKSQICRIISMILIVALLFTIFIIPFPVGAANVSDVTLGTYDLETYNAAESHTANVSYTAFDNGSNGYLLADNNGTGPAAASHAFSMVSGRTYTAKYDFYLMKKSTNTNNCLFALHAYRAAGQIMAETYPNNSSYNTFRWYTMSWNFTADTTTTNDFNLYVYEGAEVIVDNLTITDNLGNIVLSRTYESASDNPNRTYYSIVNASQIYALYPNTQNGELYLNADSGSAVTYTIPDSHISYSQLTGGEYRITFDYRVATFNSGGTQFAFLQNGSDSNAISGNSGNARGNVWAAAQVSDTATHSGQITFTAVTSTVQLRVYGGAAVFFDNFVVEKTVSASTKAELNATVRRNGNDQFVDVTFNTGASATRYNYNIQYDPNILQYVSTSSATGTSGISASASNTVSPAIEQMVIDATYGEAGRDFDFSNSIQYTNTTGEADSSYPQPTYFTMRVRCTGTTQDVHGYEFHTRVNEADYYPAHNYFDIATLNDWTEVSIVTHSNPPAEDGQNTLNISVYPGVVMEFDYIRVYSGWSASGTLLSELDFAGDNTPTPATGRVNVSTSSFLSKTGNIATSTFRLIGDIEGTTDLGLTVTTPSSVVNAFGETVSLNNNFGMISARTDNGTVRFALSLPTDSSGEFFVTGDGETVRPTQKGYLLALGYHAPQNMTVSSTDPYIQNVPVSVPESNVIAGVRYTVAVIDPTMEDKTFIAARFYVGYLDNGQTKYVYSEPFSVNRNQLGGLSSDEWMKAVQSDGSVSVTVDNSTPVQENWQGANAVAQGFIFNNGYTQEQINTEIARMKAMGINMVRSYFDETFNATYNSYSNTITFTYNRSRMVALKQWLQALKDNDIEVALNVSWAISDIFEQTYTCYDGWSNKSGVAVVNPLNAYYKRNGKDKTIEAYGAWVNASVDYLIEQCGYTNIKYLVMFTEPGVSSNSVDYWPDYINFAASADSALKAAGNRNLVKLVGPNVAIGDSTHTGSLTGDLEYFDVLKNYIDIYSFHFYAPHWPASGGSDSNDGSATDNVAKYSQYFSQFAAFAEERGKSYWFDEFNYSAGSVGITAQQENPLIGTQMAQAIVSAMNSGVENALLWQLFEIKWPGRSSTTWEFENGIHVIGLAPSLSESDVPYAPYYAYSLLTKYLGERGSTVYAGGGSNGVYSTMVENADGTVSVAVINTNDSAKSVTTNFATTLNGKKLYRICYNPSLIHPDNTATVIGADRVFVNVTDSLTDTIPANGFVIYTTVGYENNSVEMDAGEYALGGNLTAQMKNDSVLNMGNRARLSEKIDLLENGETVKIAFIGGSISAGDSADPILSDRFSSKFTAWLRQRYPNAMVTELNAGIRTTTSYLGVHRADAVLTQNPDIVIVDFAVDDDLDSALHLASYESLINKIWNIESEPAVIGVAMSQMIDGELTNTQINELTIAQKYGVPLLSYGDMIEPLLNNGVIEWSDIGADAVHPNSTGHDLVCKMLAAYFERVSSALISETEPNFDTISNKNAPYENGIMLSPGNSEPTLRYFTADTVNLLHGFEGYWLAQRSGAQIQFKDISAQYIGVAYEEVDSETAAAVFEVYVDGTLVATVDPHRSCSHAMGVQVYVGDAVGTHTVNIKTKSADACRIIGLLVS